MMTEQEFMPLIAILQAGINREFSGLTKRTWYDCLSDIPAICVSQAVKRWLLQTENGFPTIATIRKLAIEYRDGQTPEPGMLYQRWRQAVKKFHDNQQDEAEQFCGPLCWEVIQRCGGWVYLMSAPTTDRQRIAQIFEKRAAEVLKLEHTQHILPEALQPAPVRFLPGYESPRLEEPTKLFPLASKLIEDAGE